MEENVSDVLGIAEKPTPETKEAEAQKVDNSAENTLITIAYIVLGCGSVATIICMFTMVVIEDPAYHYDTKYMFNPAGFATTIMVLLSSLISWGIMTVLANISLTLKDIKGKMK